MDGLLNRRMGEFVVFAVRRCLWWYGGGVRKGITFRDSISDLVTLVLVRLLLNAAG